MIERKTMTEPLSGDQLRAYLKRRAAGNPEDDELPMFILQQHQTDNLHFNLRFEVANGLMSWALPDAPWPNPEAKRAAVPVPDYPLDRALFEGPNLDGQYGGGVVLLWDAGTYRLMDVEDPLDPQAMLKAISAGKVQVWLEGQKLKGGWSLVRSGVDNAWVFEKMRDDHADPEANLPTRRPESVLSGHTIQDWTGFDIESPRALGDRGDEGNLYGGRRPDA
jgi:DNA ligase D-like protein (predicted 3'-phosphoesterase)